MRFGWIEAAALTAASVVSADELAYSPPFYPSPWANGQGDWASAYERAVAIVSQMTLAEKVNLTTGTGWELEKCVGQTGGVPRLGIPGMCGQDSPLGVRDSDYNSAFPAGINIGATWDKNLAYLRGQAMGQEFSDKGADFQLGPVAGPLGRAPDGGRNWEGFSPDPALTGVLFAETIKGIQDAGVVATAKHFIGYEQEHFREAPEAQGYGYNITESGSANIDDKTMHELYLWPFADAVRAGVGAIMCSYNQINNSYACQNSYALNKLLKGELGFQGFVMSDWEAHHSGASAAMAGLDMSMPGDVVFDSGTSYWGTNLTIGVLNGTVPQWRVDDMAVRIMAAYYKVGRDRLWTPPNFSSWTRDEYGFKYYYSSEGPYEVVNHFVDVRRNHSDLIRRIGADSTVLLKNDGCALPLTGTERKVALIGEDAGSNPYGADGCSDRGCDNGTLAMGWGSGTTEYPYLVTPEQAIQAEVIQNGGTVFAVTDNWAISQMETLAAEATVSLVFVNADSGEGYIDVDGNMGDRNNLTLWGNGDNVIKAAASNCNNTIVIIHSVGPVLVNEWYDHPNVTAILWAGLPGQESGNSLADVLYGRVNPGAKSPFTWGKTRESYQDYLITEPNNGDGAPQEDFTEGVFIDYRGFDKRNETPIYEFGYGLSYTTFNYSQLQVQALNASAYTPASGETEAAPTLGEAGNASDYLYPSGLQRITAFIYPWLNSTDLEASSGDSSYGQSSDFLPEGATDGSAQPILPAGGGPGGNPALYDDLIQVSVTIKNTGDIAGDEIPQLYVSLGGPDEPRIVLRKFDRITLQPSEEYEWTTTLTRRDLSNWDVAAQDWIVTSYPKKVYVGSSSRKLPLRASLPTVQ
ncbi:hypothetical protein BO70DRAFT_297934 [Aspergillus heteromorphus CBS 117.55]|uniref:beta-glucosidase n=1 Tax=Aspergillus heteromorphus CBS 117.55 TaxID=1448321 RepID=A0A317VEV7_9EURO|nr:uncharacterized protein BO70DRAFT_297934 [Aspergillus heteromorphus CBS 117.55]PWY72425.1 hypothetical protein BO70DRAFT_297934 [Aspergillus heteromorphus CBS 117.55]